MSETTNIQNQQVPGHIKGVFRQALLRDAKAIQKLIMIYADKGLMLPRSLSELYETIRQYILYEEDGKIVGVCGLHITWEDLAEIRALCVEPPNARRGIGRQLTELALAEAKHLGVPKVFTLTYAPDFFAKLGFTEIDKNELPHKIWGDCVRCHKFPDCDETGMIIDVK